MQEKLEKVHFLRMKNTFFMNPPTDHAKALRPAFPSFFQLRTLTRKKARDRGSSWKQSHCCTVIRNQKFHSEIVKEEQDIFLQFIWSVSVHVSNK